MARKGSKKASAQNQAYKLENRHKTNKLKTMRRTLKNQPNNVELERKIKEIAK